MRETFSRQHGPLLLSAALITAIAAAGCRSDERLVELSRESMNRQAEQNAQMARQSEAVTKTTEELIQSESNVQHDTSQLNTQLHSERSTLDEQRQDLENERRSLANQRQRDPIIAEAIGAAVALFVAALPLVVCWSLIRSLFFSARDDSAAAEILIEQLANPTLLAASPAPGLLSIDGNIPLGLLPGVGELDSDEQFRRPVAVVVEGAHDVEFLKRISRLLSARDPSLPSLADWESADKLTFVIRNGALVPVVRGLKDGVAAFHILDREMAPETAQRVATARVINSDRNCEAVLTTKRAIENYLHPAAVREARGIEVAFGDLDDVADTVAHAMFDENERSSWESLSRRARRRLRDKAKKWLNRDAVDRMTPERLAERDPHGEVIGWLRAIAALATTPVDASA